MKKFSLLLLLLVSPAFALENFEEQSEFVGPVKLLVWKHWQPSWNVERQDPTSYEFILRRGREFFGEGRESSFIELSYLPELESGMTAKISGNAYVRTGDYGTALQALPSIELTSRVVSAPEGHGNRKVSQFFSNQGDLFTDIPGKQLVTDITFEIFKHGRSVYHYTVRPMVVRGSKFVHWDNQIDPYSAHAGSGDIRVANALSAESGLDVWDGVPVAPTLNFQDFNVLGLHAEIGLHRHEANQEAWVVLEGSVEVQNGVAVASTVSEEVLRKWNSAGDMQKTQEFEASGGWIEKRVLRPGEMSVIVPNPAQKEKVCFHSLKALGKQTKTFTMGTKN